MTDSFQEKSTQQVAILVGMVSTGTDPALLRNKGSLNGLYVLKDNLITLPVVRFKVMFLILLPLY